MDENRIKRWFAIMVEHLEVFKIADKTAALLLAKSTNIGAPGGWALVMDPCCNIGTDAKQQQ